MVAQTFSNHRPDPRMKRKHIGTIVRWTLAAVGVAFIAFTFVWTDHLQFPAGYEAATPAGARREWPSRFLFGLSRSGGDVGRHPALARGCACANCAVRVRAFSGAPHPPPLSEFIPLWLLMVSQNEKI